MLVGRDLGAMWRQLYLGPGAAMALTSADVAICVLFHEKAEQTLECVQSVRGMGAPVYILNNASSAASTAVLREGILGMESVFVHESSANLGVGRGRNRLVAETREPWILFLDNDITVTTDDALGRLARHVAENCSVEALVPSLYNVHEGAWEGATTLSLLSGVAAFVPLARGDAMSWFPGGASLVSRGVFERLGPYDEQMLVGFEDYELAIRAELKGFPIRARRVRDVALRHDHRRPVTDADARAFAERYDSQRHARSFRRIMEKHRVLLDNDWEPWVHRQLKDLGVLHPRSANFRDASETTMRARVMRAVDHMCDTPVARVAVYGAGKAGAVAVDALQARGHSPVSVMDADPSRWGETVLGVPVVSVAAGLDAEPDAVLLASTVHGREMWRQVYDEGSRRGHIPIGFAP